MKKGAKCIARTINLSVPNKPKEVQKLVSADITEPCPNLGHGSSSYWTPKPVHVKICTRKDMQRICAPKICVCPPKPARRTKAQIFFIIIVFLMKSATVGTLLYWMYTDGNLPFFPDIDKINIPRLENTRYSMIQKYNRAVIKIMNILVDLPQKTFEKLSSIIYGPEKTSEKTTEDDNTNAEDNIEKPSNDDR
ncbi:hypothetical protein HZH66_009558 [Vespula vulgaris]|uniref:Uncharacterized protein n=1 Tax=Vespula vulgaris TaxID=7454 RepID=A0A834JLI7_VESVU|nr:uncharacterized protein LOC127066459 [Vespula vulgaris]KAF7391078.1 hypothetical protein HZH66_009558 [Vespula vulgaris]